jgi:hypothetical protein
LRSKYYSIIKIKSRGQTYKVADGILSSQAMAQTSGDTRNSRDTIPIPENWFMSRNSDSRPIGNSGGLTPTWGGEHAEQDMPEALDRARKRHPKEKIIYVWPFSA